MPAIHWIIAALIANAPAIAVVGTVAATVSSVESAAVNAIVLKEKLTEPRKE